MWFTKRALGLHATVVVVVPIFLGLFWWQVQRVRQGNTLSWAYVFEWPFFTGYAVYLWWRLVHEQPGLEPPGSARRPAPVVRRPSSPSPPAPAATATATALATASPTEPASEVDEELAAYNRYLAELNATGRPKRW